MTDLERYALSFPIPGCNLPALPNDATEAQLEERAREIGYDLIRDSEGERGLVSTLFRLGVSP